MSKKAFDKIRIGLEEALAYARGGIVDSSGNVFADLGLGPEAANTARPEVAEAIRGAYARARSNVVQWRDDPRVQEMLRRNHAEMKAKLGR